MMLPVMVLLWAVTCAHHAYYDGWDVVRVPLEELGSLLDEVDVWKVDNTTAEVLLAPGSKYPIVHRNVSKSIEEERQRLSLRARFAPGVAPADFFAEVGLACVPCANAQTSRLQYRDAKEYDAFIEASISSKPHITRHSKPYSPLTHCARSCVRDSRPWWSCETLVKRTR